MTKKDLKTGWFGVMSNGNRFVIVDNIMVYLDGGFDWVDDLDDNLGFPIVHRKIEKLFQCNSFDQLDRVLNGKLFVRCVYDSKETVEMTISEIENKLGIKNLKIIKEDK